MNQCTRINDKTRDTANNINAQIYDKTFSLFFWSQSRRKQISTGILRNRVRVSRAHLSLIRCPLFFNSRLSEIIRAGEREFLRKKNSSKKYFCITLRVREKPCTVPRTCTSYSTSSKQSFLCDFEIPPPHSHEKSTDSLRHPPTRGRKIFRASFVPFYGFWTVFSASVASANEKI